MEFVREQYAGHTFAVLDVSCPTGFAIKFDAGRLVGGFADKGGIEEELRQSASRNIAEGLQLEDDECPSFVTPIISMALFPPVKIRDLLDGRSVLNRPTGNCLRA